MKRLISYQSTEVLCSTEGEHLLEEEQLLLCWQKKKKKELKKKGNDCFFPSIQYLTLKLSQFTVKLEKQINHKPDPEIC